MIKSVNIAGNIFTVTAGDEDATVDIDDDTKQPVCYLCASIGEIVIDGYMLTPCEHALEVYKYILEEEGVPNPEGGTC